MGYRAMTRKHRSILAGIHAKPTPSDIRWQDVVSALKHFGVVVTERSGSRVLLKKGTERIVIHRPHPGPTGQATLRDIAAFLETVGVLPSRGPNNG